MGGLEDVFFIIETPKDAANYLVVKQDNARHVGTQGYRGAIIVSRVIEDMVPPGLHKNGAP